MMQTQHGDSTMAPWRRVLRRWWPILVFVTVASAAWSIAWAQAVTPPGGDFTWDFAMWGTNPLMMIAAVAFFVDLLREEYAWIHGRLVTLITALLVGAIIGVLVQAIGLLAVEPFVTYNFPLGGLAYGLASGISTVVGVNLIDVFGTRIAKARYEDDVRRTTAALTEGRKN